MDDEFEGEDEVEEEEAGDDQVEKEVEGDDQAEKEKAEEEEYDDLLDDEFEGDDEELELVDVNYSEYGELAGGDDDGDGDPFFGAGRGPGAAKVQCPQS
jgi:hypothetical protein